MPRAYNTRLTKAELSLRAAHASAAAATKRIEQAKQRRIDDAVRQLVDSAPKLTEQQRSTIRAALRGA